MDEDPCEFNHVGSGLSSNMFVWIDVQSADDVKLHALLTDLLFLFMLI